jgi:hypothetical protein
MYILEKIFSETFITKEQRSKVKIEEKECSFEFKNLSDSLYVFKPDKSDFKHLGKIFYKLSENCDGVFLGRKGRSQYLVFLEMKKTLSFQSFTKALKQLLATSIKSNILLSNFIKLTSFKIYFIIAVCSIKDENEEKFIQKNYASLNPAIIFLYKRLKEKKKVRYDKLHEILCKMIENHKMDKKECEKIYKNFLDLKISIKLTFCKKC